MVLPLRFWISGWLGADCSVLRGDPARKRMPPVAQCRGPASLPALAGGLKVLQEVLAPSPAFVGRNREPDL